MGFAQIRETGTAFYLPVSPFTGTTLQPHAVFSWGQRVPEGLPRWRVIVSAYPRNNLLEWARFGFAKLGFDRLASRVPLSSSKFVITGPWVDGPRNAREEGGGDASR
jgi:hypothetical protein